MICMQIAGIVKEYFHLMMNSYIIFRYIEASRLGEGIIKSLLIHQIFQQQYYRNVRVNWTT